MRQIVDHLFSFCLTVGYLVRLPRAFRLTQDTVKIVGSVNFPGICKNIFSNFKKIISICLNLNSLVQKTNVPELS
jgi:hypothetical protein